MLKFDATLFICVALMERLKVNPMISLGDLQCNIREWHAEDPGNDLETLLMPMHRDGSGKFKGGVSAFIVFVCVESLFRETESYFYGSLFWENKC